MQATRVNDHKKIVTRGSPVLSLCTPRIQACQRGKGVKKVGDWAINISGRFMVLHVSGETPDALASSQHPDNIMDQSP